MGTDLLDLQIFNEMQTNSGATLGALSHKKPVLLVFLRHFGCTFCREALSDLSDVREEIEDRGVQIVFVHMTNREIADRYFTRYELEGVEHISDPDCNYYKAFGLVKGNLTQLFGLHSWIRGFSAGVVQGHGVGVQQLGDGFQMPGIFIIQHNKIVESFIHKLASDRPNYLQLVDGAMVNSKV